MDRIGSSSTAASRERRSVKRDRRQSRGTTSNAKAGSDSASAPTGVPDQSTGPFNVCVYASCYHVTVEAHTMTKKMPWLVSRRWEYFCPPPPELQPPPPPAGPADPRMSKMEARIQELEQMVATSKKEAREEAWKRYLAEKRAELMVKMTPAGSESG